MHSRVARVLLVVAFVGEVSLSLAGTSRKTRAILDVDTGVDDAVAIMMALSLNVSVEAITCVSGNTNLERAYENTLRVLRVLANSQIPVYNGSRQPIDGALKREEDYFASDGFGGVSQNYPPGETPVINESPPAAMEMINLARGSPGELTLFLLAPLTNVALAMMIDPDFSKNLKGMYILGGNIKGRGIILPGSSFNFYGDPEAAHVVLSRAECPVTIVPLEIILESPLYWHTYNSLIRRKSKKAKFFAAITNHSVSCCKYNPDGYTVGDPLAIIAAVVPQSVTASEERRVAVELTGTYTRGQMVQAWSEAMLPEVNKSVTIVTEFSANVIAQTFMEMLKGSS